MKRFILSAVALVAMSGLFAGSVEAARGSSRGGSRGGSRGVSHGVSRGVSHGVSHGVNHGVGHGVGGVAHGVGGGFRYAGHSFPYGYRNWGRVWYNPSYRCNWYFNAGLNEWFYYYAPQQVYLPVSQIAIYPPTVVVNGPAAPALPPSPPFAAPYPSPGAMPPGM